MTAVLSDLERKILDYMVHYLRTHTYQPSIREIGEEFGIKSTKTVSEHLGSLAEKGYLERNPSRSRGVRILDVDLHPDTVSIPCYGALPDPSRRHRSTPESHFDLDRRLAGAKGAYFVRVQGGEYSGVGIQAGDLFLVEPFSGSDLRDGELVTTSTDRGQGLFRVLRGDGKLALESASGSDVRVVEDTSALEVTGRVTVLHRRLDGTGVPRSTVAH